MGKYRPEGWKNPYVEDVMCEQGADETCRQESFEVGADAMLEGLRNLRDSINDPDINYYDKGECAEGFYPDGGFPCSGRLVFIPEEKDVQT